VPFAEVVDPAGLLLREEVAAPLVEPDRLLAVPFGNRGDDRTSIPAQEREVAHPLGPELRQERPDPGAQRVVEEEGSTGSRAPRLLAAPPDEDDAAPLVLEFGQAGFGGTVDRALLPKEAETSH